MQLGNRTYPSTSPQNFFGSFQTRWLREIGFNALRFVNRLLVNLVRGNPIKFALHQGGAPV